MKCCLPAMILSTCSVISVLMRNPFVIAVSEVIDTWRVLNRMFSTWCFVVLLFGRVLIRVILCVAGG